MIPWIAAKLSSKALPWALAGLLLLPLGVQSYRLGKAQERAGTLQAQLEQQAIETQEAIDANKSYSAAMQQLEARIDEMVEARRVQQAERDRLLAERDTLVTEARNEAEKARRERRDLWRQTRSGEGLQTLVVDTACSPIAARLRERSQGGGGD